MLILSFESSCDETAAAVCEFIDGKRIIRSDIIASQVDTHRLYGGVVPEIAGRAHCDAITGITYEALERAGVTHLRHRRGRRDEHAGADRGALLVGVSFREVARFRE